MSRFRYGTQPIEEPEARADLVKLFELFDGEHTAMFASDWPHHDFDHTQHVFGLPFGAEARRRIMGLNAAEFFRIEPSRVSGVESIRSAGSRTCRPAPTASSASRTASSASSTSDGTVHAIPNLCPHQRGPLCEGAVSGTIDSGPHTDWKLAWIWDGEVVTCPWHSLEFHVPTGRCVAFADIRLRTYEVRVTRRRRAAGGRVTGCRSRSSPALRGTAGSGAGSPSPSPSAATTSPSTTSRTRTRAGAASRRSRRSAAGRSSCRGDVRTRAGNDRLVAETVDRLGRLDAFVANAGVARWQRLTEVTREDWAFVMGVNLTASSTAAARRRRSCAPGRRRTDRRHVLGQRRDAVHAARGLRSVEARRRPARRRDGPGMGRRRDRREPRRAGLGGLEHQRRLAGLRDRGAPRSGAGGGPVRRAARRAGRDRRGRRLPRWPRRTRPAPTSASTAAS